jgi:hypothetical protein
MLLTAGAERMTAEHLYGTRPAVKQLARCERVIGSVRREALDHILTAKGRTWRPLGGVRPGAPVHGG